jgi:hypothetical protein
LASETVIPEYFAFDAETPAVRHAVLAAEIRTLRTCLMLLQDANGLLVASYPSLHRPSLPMAGPQSQIEEKSRGRSLDLRTTVTPESDADMRRMENRSEAP